MIAATSVASSTRSAFDTSRNPERTSTKPVPMIASTIISSRTVRPVARRFMVQSQDLMSSSVPSLASSPIDVMPTPFTPAGAFWPHSILNGLPHGSLTSLLFMNSDRSSMRSGHALSGCAAAHCGYASSANFFAVSFAMSTFDLLNAFITFGPTTRPMTSARIASTIMISRSVMPRWERAAILVSLLRIRSISLLGAGERAEVHDGLQDREHDERDCAAHDHEHERFEQSCQARKLGVDF